MDHHARSPGVFVVGVALVGTVLLSPLMLVLAINGLFLGILLLPVLPFLALGWIAAEGLRRGAPIGAALGARREVLPQALPAPAPAPPLRAVPLAAVEAVPFPSAPLVAVAAADALLAPVKLRVASARGVCPVGYRYEAGTEYVFLNGDVTPAFCPVAQRALAPLVAQVRRGEIPGTLKPFCKTSVHEVVFEFALGASSAAQEKEPALP